MPKTRFLASVKGFWPGRQGRTRDPWIAEAPKIQNSKIFLALRVLTKKIFRLLKHPKRLGLGQKVPGKHPFGPIEPQFITAKNTGFRKDQNGPKMAFLHKTVFRVLAIKRAKQGNFFIVGYI